MADKIIRQPTEDKRAFELLRGDVISVGGGRWGVLEVLPVATLHGETDVTFLNGARLTVPSMTLLTVTPA
jgi:hypothetical protein